MPLSVQVVSLGYPSGSGLLKTIFGVLFAEGSIMQRKLSGLQMEKKKKSQIINKQSTFTIEISFCSICDNGKVILYVNESIDIWMCCCISE